MYCYCRLIIFHDFNDRVRYSHGTTFVLIPPRDCYRAPIVSLELVLFKWSMPMWILMFVFSYSVSPAATNDRAEWRLLPTVVFQEFSNEERCRAAKSKLEGSLKEAGAKLRSGLEDLRSIGKADPAQIIVAFNVECLPK